MNYLVKNTDYTLAYPTAEYITAGTKQITINGIGNYCGSKTVSYEVTGGPAAGYNVYISQDYFDSVTDGAIYFSIDNGSTYVTTRQLTSYAGQLYASNVENGNVCLKAGEITTQMYYHYSGEAPEYRTTGELELDEWVQLPLTADLYLDGTSNF